MENQLSILAWPVPDWEKQYSYHSGARRFGSNRDGGNRKHAGCDIYAPKGSKVVAITHGRVVSAYVFYGGTSAIEIDHGAFGYVRYGEITPNPDMKPGKLVEAGTEVGTVAIIKGHGKLHPMLHLEMYTGKATGQLSLKHSSNPFKRRSDLINPTEILDKLCFCGPQR
jgi:murein DD-endopeptidase MepM/ murein hydrolase activator NlpD